jgi:hypothetical protein
MFRFLLTIVLSLGLLACASDPKPVEDNDKPRGQTLWPLPPEMPRYRYMMQFTSSDDLVEKDSEARFREMVLGRSLPQYIIKRPLALAGDHGMVYLIDAQDSAVNVFDLVRRRHFKLGYRYEGKLTRPVDIEVDRQGFVYVADRGRNSIIVYDAIGLYQKHIELGGITNQLGGLAFDRQSEFLYVVDRGGIDSDRHQIVKLNRDGEVVARFGRRGGQPGEFNLPLDIALDSQNRVYVLDAGNFRVQVLDEQGEFIRAWGQPGNSFGQFGQPRSITIDGDDLVYVSDTQFGNVQVFDDEGRLLLPIGTLAQENVPGSFSLITGVNVDAKGFLYVLDQFLGKIEIYKKLSPEEQRKALEDYQADAVNSNPAR